MNADEQRIAIARACGWTHVELFAPTYTFEDYAEGKRDGVAFVRSLSPDGRLMQPPDYLSDLNACHEMEKVLTPAQQAGYYAELYRMLAKGQMSLRHQQILPMIFATAAQKSECFLKALTLRP